MQISARCGTRMEIVWYVRYSIGGKEKNGMVVSRDGEIIGADHTNTFTGTYSVNGAHVSANVLIAHTCGPRIILNTSDPVKLTLTGSMKENTALLHGYLDHKPAIEVTVEIERAV